MGKVLSVILIPPPIRILLKIGKKTDKYSEESESGRVSSVRNKTPRPKTRVGKFCSRLKNGFKRYVLSPFIPCVLHNFHYESETSKSRCKRIITRAFTDKTLENKLLKAILGFISGIMFGVLFFVFLLQMMHVPVVKASNTCVFVGCISAFGLAFSKNFRCISFLIIPELFSTRGRSVLLACAYFLVLSGPVVNMTTNMDILTKSVSCQMESIKNRTKEDLKDAFSPILEHMDSIKKALNAVVKFSETVREAFMAFAEIIKEILEGIKRVYKWFAKMLSVCPKLMHAPEEYCYTMLKEKEMKCYEVMFILGFLCLLVRAFAEIVCPLLGVATLACNKLQEFKSEVIDPLEKRIDDYSRKIYDEFYVNITIYNFYDYRVHESQTAMEIKDAIMEEIDEKTYGLLLIFRYVSFLAFAGLAWLVFRSMLYRWKYLHVDRYDNIYLTWDIQDIDRERVDKGEESIFPLSFTERRKYLKPWSLNLTKNEKIRAIFSFTIFIMGAIQIGTYLFLDHMLFWLIETIAYHARVNFKVPLPFNAELKVQGTSYLAEMYQDMVNVFNPILKHVPEIDTRNCLPIAIPPDYETYEVIGQDHTSALLSICFALSVTEVYGLRLRHAICGCYYPERKKDRAQWLYYHMLGRKGNYLTRMRRLVKLCYKDWKDKNLVGSLTFVDYICKKLKCLRIVLGWFGYKKTFCLACSNLVEVEGNDDSISCPRPNCGAFYCQSCFTDLNNQCTACMSPLEYDDLSDISEVMDSSEDEDLVLAAIEQGKRRVFLDSEIRHINDAHSDEISRHHLTETRNA